MNSKTTLLALTLTLTLLFSCVEYHPYEANPEEENLTQKNLDRLLANPDQDTLTFGLIGDTQRFYDHTDAFVQKVKEFPEMDLVVVTGDLTDFGIEYEFELMHSVFESLPIPYVTVIGNHDLVYNGQTIYEEMYGPMNYSFSFKDFRFIMVNTNGREFAFNGQVPDLNWLQAELDAVPAGEQALIVSHVPPYQPDFDPDLSKPYVETIENSGKVLLTMNGHLHDYRTGTYPDSQVEYLNSFSTEKHQFLLVKAWKGGYRYEIISY